VLFDVFRGAPLDRGTKSLAFAVELRALDRTLTREDTDPVVNAIVERVEREFEAKLRAG
jgi:phenylalanyl-tRNA synthetase beta chain